MRARGTLRSLLLASNAALPGANGPTTIGMTATLQAQPAASETVGTYGYDGLQVVYGQVVAGLDGSGPLTPSSFLYFAGTQGGPVVGEGYASQTLGAGAAVGSYALTTVCGIC